MQVRVSYLEIYNETMYDLLAEAPGLSNGLTVTEDANGCVEVRATCSQAMKRGQAISNSD